MDPLQTISKRYVLTSSDELFSPPKKLYYIFFIWNKSLQYQTLKKWRDWFTRYQIYVSFTCLRFHMPCFREWHTESIDGYFSYGYILLACKKQDAPPQGRTAATSAPLPTAFRGNLLAAPRSCKLPAKLLRLVGMAVRWYPGGRNSGVWAWNRPKVATLRFLLPHYS